ncbi:MAG: S1/P1 nuclease [Alistipes sp.]|nr:S1/P1 nuclease [Alistipes sp.]
MKRTIIATLLALLCCSSAMAWDSRGHSAIAYIAEKHLTKRAKANIESYISGRSIVYYASWMDFNRTDPPFDVTNNWHVDYWTDAERTDSNGNPLPPNSVSQIKRIISEMDDFRSLSDSLVNINIKYLVHLVGDMHCPVHINFPTSRPMRVKIGKETVKVHAMWDGKVIDLKHNNTSPRLLANNLDIYTPEQIAAAQSGTPDDWYVETVAASKQAIAMIPESKKLTYDNYFNKAIAIAEDRITVAGYRLAAILNAIFDK